jgi:hypothetical protein
MKEIRWTESLVAHAEDAISGHQVVVTQNSLKAMQTVSIAGIQATSNSNCFNSDFLADIIVRGIRSLEAEKEDRLNPEAKELRDFNEFEDRLVREIPGHGAG